MFEPVMVVSLSKIVVIKLVYSDHRHGSIGLWRQVEFNYTVYIVYIV